MKWVLYAFLTLPLFSCKTDHTDQASENLLNDSENQVNDLFDAPPGAGIDDADNPTGISVRKPAQRKAIAQREANGLYIYDGNIQTFLTVPKDFGKKLFAGYLAQIKQKKAISNFFALGSQTKQGSDIAQFEIEKHYPAEAPIFGKGTIKAKGTLTIQQQDNRFDYIFSSTSIDAKYPFDFTKTIVEQMVVYYGGPHGTNLDVFLYKKVGLATSQGEEQSISDTTKSMIAENLMHLSLLKVL